MFAQRQRSRRDHGCQLAEQPTFPGDDVDADSSNKNRFWKAAYAVPVYTYVNLLPTSCFVSHFAGNIKTHVFICTATTRPILPGGSHTHLKMGDSMAQLSAQPRATHSFAFMVRLGSLPKSSRRMVSTAGTRDELPTISTLAMSSLLSFESVSAWEHGMQRVRAASLYLSSATHTGLQVWA